MDSQLRPFHLAFPVDDLKKAREFYGTLLECPEGRSSDQWIDYNFFGHQIVTHLIPRPMDDNIAGKNPVDGHNVPVPHFGIVLEMKVFEALAERLKNAKIDFVIEPYIRFKGESGEQATMFFLDPSGNALEFKAFKNLEQLFAK